MAGGRRPCVDRSGSLFDLHWHEAKCTIDSAEPLLLKRCALPNDNCPDGRSRMLWASVFDTVRTAQLMPMRLPNARAMRS